MMGGLLEQVETTSDDQKKLFVWSILRTSHILDGFAPIHVTLMTLKNSLVQLPAEV